MRTDLHASSLCSFIQTLIRETSRPYHSLKYTHMHTHSHKHILHPLQAVDDETRLNTDGEWRESVEMKHLSNSVILNVLLYLIMNKARLNHMYKCVHCVPKSTFYSFFFFLPLFCHHFGILCTIMFSSKPICICIANIHFHFGFMCLPSLLIGFGSFPNVQCVPSNNYIPKEICMNFVTVIDG